MIIHFTWEKFLLLSKCSIYTQCLIFHINDHDMITIDLHATTDVFMFYLCDLFIMWQLDWIIMWTKLCVHMIFFFFKSCVHIILLRGSNSLSIFIYINTIQTLYYYSKISCKFIYNHDYVNKFNLIKSVIIWFLS